MTWLGKLVQISCWMGLLSIVLNAQQAPSLLGEDWQNWDELNVKTQLNSTLQATWVVQARLSSQELNPTTYLLGADFNLDVSKRLAITSSYYYFKFRTISGSEGHGHNPILAATLSGRFRNLGMSDRSRFIGALGINGNDFWAYGNRPRLEYKIGPEEWKSTVFVWDELFYFSNHNGWTRNRFAVGGEKSLNERMVASLYYQRQNDGHSRPSQINALVAVIQVRVR
jgi:hypothetical protein